MRKKCLIGIVVLLCMTYFAGCQKNSPRNTAQTDATVNQGDIIHEESDTVELAQNNSEESVTARQELPEEEINAVESTADNQFMVVIDRSRIDDQSFEVVLNEWGKVTFVSCMPDFYDENLDPLTDASFYLLKNEKVLYQFPYVSDNNIRETGLCEGVSFVFFEDINEDNKDEIVIGVLYVSGAGPQGMIPYTEIRIYEDGGNEFVYNENLSDEINEKLTDEVTAEYVKTLLGERQQDIKTIDSVEKRLLLYGDCGSNLGLGWLLYTVPNQESQDYKIYFFSCRNREDDEYKSFEEIDFDLEQADFIFPDARENNMAIGKFIDMYLDENFTTESGKSARIVIATYEIEGKQYYDTRIYTPDEGGYGYVLDESMTEELNALYADVEEYPVWQIIEMPHD